ncbi:MAG TPA: sigma-70 family RNA polymerase sigma factor [Chthonomonadaceae bacterium]|nr:sigma-70 family RNA polymerase sigma factor [Chthonomonadaceae bacterium]
MEEIRGLIDKATAARAAQAEKHQAFGQIVRRFQDMVFGCAYALLGDFHLAEDAAQETFIVAWRCLDQLRAPEAFPGWLKRIALTQCHHLTRGKSLSLVALEAARDLPSAEAGPQEALEQADRRQRVLAAIQALPEAERMVTTLFYIGEYSQNEIAAFLEVPLTTVKKRLWCARQKLREKMLDIVRDTLQEKRPSKDERFASTVALYNEALEALVNKLKQDRYILAAILYGSLSYDEVWEKSDIDLLLISAEEKKGEKAFNLVENGVNIHATLVPRSQFKKMLEGALQSSFMHSCFAKSTLLFSWDESIKEYYADPPSVGAADRQWQLLKAGSEVVYLLAKAEKWLFVKHDVSYSFLWTLYAVNSLARIETLIHSEVTAREVIHQALKHNPRFFKAVYTDLIHDKKDEAVLRAALEQINRYLDEKVPLLFQPVLDFLSESGGARSTTELDAYLGPKVQTHSLASAYEWLADKGVIRKVSAPVRLHEKSRVTMDEAAYYYDGNL